MLATIEFPIDLQRKIALLSGEQITCFLDLSYDIMLKSVMSFLEVHVTIN